MFNLFNTLVLALSAGSALCAPAGSLVGRAVDGKVSVFTRTSPTLTIFAVCYRCNRTQLRTHA